MRRLSAVFIVASLAATGPGHADWHVGKTNALFSATQYIVMTGTSTADRALVVGCRRGGDLFIAYTEPSAASAIPASGNVDLIVKAGRKDTYSFAAQPFVPDANSLGLRVFDKGPVVEFLKDIRDAAEVISIGFERPGHVTKYDISAKGSTKAANELLDLCEL